MLIHFSSTWVISNWTQFSMNENKYIDVIEEGPKKGHSSKQAITHSPWLMSHSSIIIYHPTFILLQPWITLFSFQWKQACHSTTTWQENVIFLACYLVWAKAWRCLCNQKGSWWNESNFLQAKKAKGGLWTFLCWETKKKKKKQNWKYLSNKKENNT